MKDCKICGKFFRDDYNLNTHMTRIKPCNSLKNTPEGKKDTLEGKKDTLEGKKDTLKNLKKCKYCLKIFSSKKYNLIHEYKCKYKDDPVRLMEMEKHIIPVLPDSKTECRYCNKNLCRTALLNNHLLICKEREDYFEKLKESTKYNTINSNTINSNNINSNNQINNILLNFGQENLTHIQTENIIKLLRDIRKEFGNDQVYLMAGNLIDSFDNYIREKPENKNVIIPNSKCLYAEIKKENGWKKVCIDRCLNQAFKSSANELYNKKEEINNQNDKVFKSETNEEIFSEVKHFANKGFNHGTLPEELRKIKSSFKINKLK